MLLPAKSARVNRWIWRIIVGGVFVIPLVVALGGKDSFRIPKEVFFRAEAILIAAIWLALLVTRNLQGRPNRRDPFLILPAAVILWSLVAMSTSTNRFLSLQSLLWIAGWTLIFVATYLLARSHAIAAVYVAIVPAVINAVLVLLQESGLWNPFFPGQITEHAYHSALIGNPNDVGTFLVAPTLAALGLAIVHRGTRWLAASLTVVLFAAAVANHTLTALIALTVGVLGMIFVVSKRWTLAATCAMAIAAVAIIAYYPPLRARYDFTMRFLRAGYYDTVTSGRALPYLTAMQMFLDRPIAGVGPGCFKWEYFPYKLKTTVRYKQLALTGTTVNYGEVHNDHLQILAETGLPGYALFAAALLVIAGISFRQKEAATAEGKFSRLCAFPLATAFVILALGQFPLELAAPTSVNLFLFALCGAWRPNDEDGQ
jgi:O-antigen ligase